MFRERALGRVWVDIEALERGELDVKPFVNRFVSQAPNGILIWIL